VGGLQWERVALTAEQVAAHRLPSIVKHDRRYKDRRPHEAVECEAISQRVLIDILRARFDEMLPEPLQQVLEREARQRVKLERLLRRARA
jgi:hypothetical protein